MSRHENYGLWAIIIFTLFAASTGYLISGQPAIAITLLIGMFPVIMSVAMRKGSRF